jgi:hypothetical protein
VAALVHVCVLGKIWVGIQAPGGSVHEGTHAGTVTAMLADDCALGQGQCRVGQHRRVDGCRESQPGSL